MVKLACKHICWPADNLSSAYLLPFTYQPKIVLKFTNSWQKPFIVCLLSPRTRPRVPAPPRAPETHVPVSLHPISHRPHVPKSPCACVPKCHVLVSLHPKSLCPTSQSQSPSSHPTFSHSLFLLITHL